MKISPSGIPPVVRSTERLLNPPGPVQQTGTIEGAITSPGTSDTHAARLITLLSQRGIPVSSAEALEIEAELMKSGILLSDVDSEVALKALILHRSNIPLNPELLRNDFSGKSTIFQQLGMVYENARALLSDNALSVETRSILEILVKDIDGLLSALREQARSGSAVDFPEGAVFGTLNDGIPFPIRDLLQNSGLMLEWKLLAWYRSGGDPARLYDLLHRDVKGILNNFLANLTSHRPGGKAGKKLGTLDRDVRSLLDSVEQRQVSMILSNRGERRDMYIELPFGDQSGGGSARIRARGKKKSDSAMLEPARFNLTFDVETSNIGRVQATMHVVGKTISFSFLFETEQAAEQAGSMKDDFAASLVTRGYMIGSVSIGLADDRQADTGAETARSKGVDLVG